VTTSRRGARLRPGALLLLTLGAVLLPGCGSKDKAQTASTAPTQTQAQAHECPASGGSGAEIALPKLHVVNEWRLDSQNTTDAFGCVTYGGKPVAGA
jgi:hypothetical protein